MKSPVVYTAGLLRTLGRGVDGNAWTQLAQQSGQRLFYPPDVAGWDKSRWLDTATFRARWQIAAKALAPIPASATPAKPPVLLAHARHLLGDVTLTKTTTHALLGFAGAALKNAHDPALVEIALRQLVAVSPEANAA